MCKCTARSDLKKCYSAESLDGLGAAPVRRAQRVGLARVPQHVARADRRVRVHLHHVRDRRPGRRREARRREARRLARDPFEKLKTLPVEHAVADGQRDGVRVVVPIAQHALVARAAARDEKKVEPAAQRLRHAPRPGGEEEVSELRKSKEEFRNLSSARNGPFCAGSQKKKISEI